MGISYKAGQKSRKLFDFFKKEKKPEKKYNKSYIQEIKDLTFNLVMRWTKRK